jgi:hypothetical protein
MNSFILGILNELPERLAQYKLANKLQPAADTPNDMKYTTGIELTHKLESMTELEFVGNFTTHLYNVYACSHGLSAIQVFYDYTVDDIERSKTIMSMFNSFIILETICFYLYFALYSVPQFREEQAKLKDKTKKVEKRDHMINYTMKWMLIIGISLTVIVLLNVSTQRRERIGLYNNEIMLNNATTVKQESIIAFDTTIESIKTGQLLNIPQGSAILDRLDVNIYALDAFKENIGLFDTKRLVSIGPGFDAEYLRDKLVEIIDANSKCNALLFGADLKMPFPSYEIAIYMFLLIIVIVSLVMITMTLEPFDNLQKIKYWRKMLENKSRMQKGYLWLTPQKNGIESNLGESTDLIIKILALIMIPLSTFLFTSQILQSTTTLSTALYGSTLYRNSLTYTI